MSDSKYRNLEPCNLENIGESLCNKIQIESRDLPKYLNFGLKFQELNVTSIINDDITKEFKLKNPKTIEYKTDYLELIRFLKNDITYCAFDFTKELGKLLSICAKYKCKIVFSPELWIGEESCSGIFYPNSKDDFKYIFIKIKEDDPGYLVEFKSTKDFINTLRHEVFHLIQHEFGFEVLGVDVFDEAAKDIFNSGAYENCSINEFIQEFEAWSTAKVPFMACEIESHLSEFSTIKDCKYAASPQRINTIQLIARERRIPIYTKMDKSIFLEDKEIEKIFSEEL